MRKTILLICVLALVACQPTQPKQTEQMQVKNVITTPESADSTQVIQATIANRQLVASLPARWDTLATERGIVLTRTNPVFEGKMHGLAIHLFIPEAANLLPGGVPDSDNVALVALNHVVNSPAYIGEAQVRQPVPIQWGEHRAAYYTLRGKGDILTLLVTVALPDDTLVALNFSAPEGHAHEIGQLGPKVLEDIQVNNHTLRGEQLADSLPVPLPFPIAGNDGITVTARGTNDSP